jgi:glucokinase
MKKQKYVIGIDLGGTKIAAALLAQNGKILAEEKQPSQLQNGWSGLRQQILEICGKLQKIKKVSAVGIGSAGPLHAPSGKLLDPTNFGWGPKIVPLTKDLEKSLKLPVKLENDAACAALAEYWKGKAGGDCVILTLGTGLGVGVLLEGKLLRGSRGLHPEMGHQVLRPNDADALCGCGNLGCAEALLSGVNVAKRAARQWGLATLTGKELWGLAERKDPRALAAFAEYSDLLGNYFFNLVTTFYPKKIILTGSFAEAHRAFLPEAKNVLKKLLTRRLQTMPIEPEVRLSSLGNRAGIYGAAYIALQKEYFLSGQS